jgi:hypothetical protein
MDYTIMLMADLEQIRQNAINNGRTDTAEFRAVVAEIRRHDQRAWIPQEQALIEVLRDDYNWCGVSSPPIHAALWGKKNRQGIEIDTLDYIRCRLRPADPSFDTGLKQMVARLGRQAALKRSLEARALDLRFAALFSEKAKAEARRRLDLI